MSGDERPYLAAVIGPLAALIIDREMGANLRRRAIDLAALGQVDASRQMSAAAAQLRESARQLAERTSAGGSGEVPQPAGEAGSEVPPGTAIASDWWPTAVVAGELRIGSRQVRNLAKPGGPLTATTVGGQLYIDPASVIEEKQRRERRRGEVA